VAGTVTANLSSSNLNSVTIGIRGSVTANSNLTATALVDLVEPVRAGVFSWADGELQGIISNSTPVISGTVTANLSSANLNTVTIGVRGTVTANTAYSSSVTGSAGGAASTVTAMPVALVDRGVYGGNIMNYDGSNTSLNVNVKGSLPAISGTVTVGNSVTIGSLPAISGTVTANLFGEAVGGGPNEPTKLQCDSNGFLITSLYRSGSDAVNYDPVAGNVSVNVKNVSSVTIGSLPAISGTVTANLSSANLNSVTIGVRGSVTLGAGTSQIGSVTASISNSVTIGSLPAISGTVTANAGSGTFNVSNRGATGEATVSNFTSTTSSTLKASNSNRKVLTIYNEGAGNLHVLYGSGTASTTNYSVKLFSGDYLEIDKYTGQVNAIFATAGTARVTEIT
jgi:hypothetical protein